MRTCVHACVRCAAGEGPPKSLDRQECQSSVVVGSMQHVSERRSAMCERFACVSDLSGVGVETAATADLESYNIVHVFERAHRILALN